MRALLRSPLLHFLVLGALVYAWQASDTDVEAAIGPAAAQEISIPPDRIASLRARFAEQMGRGPDDVELGRMIAAEVDEEILYREAVARGLLERDGGVQTRLIQKMLFLEGEATLEEAPALLARAVELGLHHEDVVVRRILVQKMRLLGGRLAPEQAVSQEDVARRYAEAREDLRAPDRMTLSHVFLSRDRRGADVEPAAERLLRELVLEAVPPAEAPRRGDPFPLGHALASRSRPDLERTFGASFGDAVFAVAEATPGRWTGPVASAYGLHLVFVESVEPGRVPPLEAVANRLRLEIEEQRRAANLEALLSDLRTRYSVRTAPEKPPARTGAMETG